MAGNPPQMLLRSEESDGHVAVVELAGAGRPPLHRHDFGETFYVLEGELNFQLGEDLFTRRAGEVAFAPRGVAHTCANLCGAPARALLVITPAGFERYFDRIAAHATGTEPPPEGSKPIPDVVTVRRLRRLMIKKRGRNLRAGQVQVWTEEWFSGHGLRGTIRYPKAA